MTGDLVMATAFARGMKEGGQWIGLPFWISGGFFLAILIALCFSGRKNNDTEEESGCDGADDADENDTIGD